MPEPQNKDDVRRILGMINYVSNFIPNATKMTAPLRELLWKDVDFQWHEEQKKALSEPVLALFEQLQL